MKIFLDDIRTIKLHDYATVRDYDSCIKLISAGRNILKNVSLDYSLGSEKTGLDVLIFMVENNIFPKNINIHSDHSIGVPIMLKYARENFPESTVITTNRV